jgi:hypothetical protein
MSEWKKLNSRKVYVTVANDISESLQRYFAPVVALINGVGKSVSMPDAWHKEQQGQDQEGKANLG